MIDTIAPDAMRGYLRERSDYLDSPHDLDAVPLAVSPEDVDEHRLCDPLPEPERPTPAASERLALLEQVRDLYPHAPSKTHREVVEWIIDGPKP